MIPDAGCSCWCHYSNVGALVTLGEGSCKFHLCLLDLQGEQEALNCSGREVSRFYNSNIVLEVDDDNDFDAQRRDQVLS